MTRRYSTFTEFWPFYVSQHLNPICRTLHFIGTGLVCVLLVLTVLKSPWLLCACPVAGYGFAWAGHFMFEKNRPATFTYPLWSLMGDFTMFFFMLTGRMSQEIERSGARCLQDLHDESR